MAFQWQNQIALIETNILNAVGDALRYRLFESDRYTPDLFEQAIYNIGGTEYVTFQYPSYSPEHAGDLWCGAKVVDMSHAFCHRTLEAEPITGPNVVNMSYAYDSAYNAQGTINFMQEFEGEESTVNGYMMFANRDTTTPLYVNLVEGSAWYNWFRTNCRIYNDTPLTWIVYDEDYMVNMETNTYIQAKLTGCVWLNHFEVNNLTTTFNVKYGL